MKFYLDLDVRNDQKRRRIFLSHEGGRHPIVLFDGTCKPSLVSDFHWGMIPVFANLKSKGVK